MTRSEALALSGWWLPLWTGNDPERLIEVYHEDVFYRDPAKPEGVSGKAALLKYLRKLLAAFPDWVWETQDVFPVAGGFVLKWRATIPVGGTTVVEDGMDLVLVDKGKVVRNEVYFDRSALLAALVRLSDAGA